MHRPASTGELIELLDQFGDDAALYCGGTELLLVMKMGMTDLGQLLDVKGIASLRSVAVVDRGLRIGAAVTYREIERHPDIVSRAPAFVSMINRIANVRVRSVGTLGGNLAFADPASDPATFLTAAGAWLELRGPTGQRTVPIEEFSVGAYQTALGPDELIEAVVLPPLAPNTSISHHRMKFQERPAITVTVATTAVGGAIVGSRVAVGAASPAPARLVDAERILDATTADQIDSAANAAGNAAADAVRLVGHSPDHELYLRQLSRVLTARSAKDAMQSALAQ